MQSSAVCENPSLLFQQKAYSFGCPLRTHVGDAIIFLVGCIGGPTECTISVQDTQNDTYSSSGSIETVCGSFACTEFEFSTTAHATGNDTITATADEKAPIGGDAYDIAGVNASKQMSAFGSSPMSNFPSTIPITPFPNGFVVAGVAANNALQFGPGNGYTLVANQPCQQCGQPGGWQASEFAFWGASGNTNAPFNYPLENDGWGEIVTSYAPNVANVSISCSPSAGTVSIASTCTASVKGDVPTGTVAWMTNGTGGFSASSCSLSSGSCSVGYTPSVPSKNLITATYGGDTDNPVASSSVVLQAGKHSSTTAVACSPASAAVGSPSTCTATVSGANPTGTITWASSGVANFSPSGTCTLASGTCAVNYIPSSTASPITLNALYSGDSNNTVSTGAFSLSVTLATASNGISSPTSTTAESSSTQNSSASSSASASSSSLTLLSSYLLIVPTAAAVLLLALVGSSRRRRVPSGLT